MFVSKIVGFNKFSIYGSSILLRHLLRETKTPQPSDYGVTVVDDTRLELADAAAGGVHSRRSVRAKPGLKRSQVRVCSFKGNKKLRSQTTTELLWWTIQYSNLWPPARQADALPAAPIVHFSISRGYSISKQRKCQEFFSQELDVFRGKGSAYAYSPGKTQILILYSNGFHGTVL